jgi:sugar lactone lactonase YvrE
VKIALLAIVGFPAILAGCARMHSPAPITQASPARVWPAPPETPRIAYVQSFSTPADFGVKASALTRFGHWITGSGNTSDALRKPFGIALDENENLCLTDTGANAVCYYEQKSRKWRQWSKVGQVRFLSPVAIAKRNGTFFVADSTLGKIVAFAEDGKLSFQITNHLERPCAVAILGERLFVADSLRHCICIFDLHGQFQKQFGARGLGKGQFNFPTHLAVNQAGALYVTDSLNSRVQIFSAEGDYQGEIGKLGDAPGHFGRPKGIAVDNGGRIYALDAAFDNLQIFDRDGHLLLALGETGSQPGQFWLANGIAITRENKIFVADSYNRRIQTFRDVGPKSE